MENISIKFKNLFPENWKDYSLIDSGNGRKLERFGDFIFDRPETQAMWYPRLDKSSWENADGVFNPANQKGGNLGKWELSDKIPKEWVLNYRNLKFTALPTPFRHLGFFPEQSPHWDWTEIQIKKFIDKYKRAPKLLNLFGYSGLATFHASASGAYVTHVDASKKAIELATQNKELSQLQNSKLRLIIDDANAFVEREYRRKKKYDGFILDPPKYGRGPKGQKWEINKSLPLLLQNCRKIFSETAFMFILNVYAFRISSVSITTTLIENLSLQNGNIDFGELGLMEDGPRARKIGQSLYSRWYLK